MKNLKNSAISTLAFFSLLAGLAVSISFAQAASAEITDAECSWCVDAPTGP